MNELADNDFSKLQNLTWFPWIGDKYFNSKDTPRILIVGESHYIGEKDLHKFENVKKNKMFTREVIFEVANKLQPYHTFSNLHRAYFGNDDINNIMPFWKAVSFYNFIQTPMKTKESRPEEHDFRIGWKNFFEVIKVLKPQTCLFIGTTAANYFNSEIKDASFLSEGIIKGEKINRNYVRIAILKDKDNNQTRLIFIRHTGKYFSWRKWGEYIKNSPDLPSLF